MVGVYVEEVGVEAEEVGVEAEEAGVEADEAEVEEQGEAGEGARLGMTNLITTGQKPHQVSLQPVRHFATKGPKRRDCVVCSNGEEGGNRHLTLYLCETFSNRPPLCPSGCFEMYHNQKAYHN